jgi:hypothetical protein
MELFLSKYLERIKSFLRENPGIDQMLWDKLTSYLEWDVGMKDI